MNRLQLLLRAYDRRDILTVSNIQYQREVLTIISFLSNLDIKQEDITTAALITDGQKGSAIITAKSPCILAGIKEISYFLAENGIAVAWSKKDGERIKERSAIMELSGNLQNILINERMVLNVLMRMSGIATRTAACAKKMRPKNIFIAGTRKTLLGILDHKAVTVGGGLSHRLGLYDAILIKKNHQLALTDTSQKKNIISEALLTAWNNKKNAQFIEIEVKNTDEARTAARAFKELQHSSLLKKIPCIIMLDNFNPKEVFETIAVLKKEQLYASALIEVSGGITEKNISDYGIDGVDVISLGFLTHSAPGTDMGLEILST